jgi:hypothetical protein
VRHYLERLKLNPLGRDATEYASDLPS